MSQFNRERTTEPQDVSGGTQWDAATTYQVRDGETAADAVVRAASAETNADETELAPLYWTVEPDALDALFAPAESGDPRATSGSVAFEYAGLRVRVTADRTVEIN